MQAMLAIEFKLLLKPAQVTTLESWMRTCCWIHNKALDMRKKSWERRKENISYNAQQSWLVEIRSRGERYSECPSEVERDALRRVDKAFKAFFQRCKSGDKPGFPRFKSASRYDSLEFLVKQDYVRGDNLISVPRLGLVKIRGGNQKIPKTQKLLRIIRRASGWYGQVVVDEVKVVKNIEDHGPIGIDVGLESFATMSDGSKIENPRFYRKSEKKLRGLQRSVSRKKKGSSNRKKAVRRLASHHERVALQRRNFCHQHSTEFVRKHPVIAVEKLNIDGMKRNKYLAKSISDAGWNTFTTQLSVKAANAGRVVVAVNPAGTSQTCPDCGNVSKKKLSERVHHCSCGLRCHRDHASARVILARALGATGVTRLSRDLTAGVSQFEMRQVDPMKQEDVLRAAR